MRPGALLGTALCAALCAGAGALLAVVLSLFLLPPLLLAFDLLLDSTDDEPFRWLLPMFVLLPAAALLGAGAGAVFAWRRLHHREHDDQDRQASAPAADGGSTPPDLTTLRLRALAWFAAFGAFVLLLYSAAFGGIGLLPTPFALLAATLALLAATFWLLGTLPRRR